MGAEHVILRLDRRIQQDHKLDSAVKPQNDLLDYDGNDRKDP